MKKTTVKKKLYQKNRIRVKYYKDFNVISLGKEGSKQFIELLKNIPEPNKALIELLKEGSNEFTK